MNIPSSYRPDIDGLRAIAVLAVIFHHFKFPGFSGGYVGVDVFFVISGYLITKIILSDLDKGAFSIASFYERRARRILPALATVLFFCLIAGYLLLLPNNFENLGQSTAAAALSLGNVFFWLKTDYFSAGTEIMPLLHTWSLGVEEQFYLFWPLILTWSVKFTRSKQLALVIAILLFSLIASEMSLHFQEKRNAFFLPQFRIWELLIGGALAFLKPRIPRRLDIVLTGIVFTILLCSIYLYTPETFFPGLAALIPCLSTFALIYLGGEKNKLTTLLLANRLATYIGKISYSLYLWHWPIIVFFRLILSRSPNYIESALLIFLTWVLSHLTWRFIEQPFRIRKPRQSEPIKPLLLATAGIAIFFSIGLMIHLSNGMPKRLNISAQFYNSFIKYEGQISSECLGSELYSQPQNCLLGHSFKMDNPHTIYWGDSHAAHLLPHFNAQLESNNKSGVAAIKYGCAPLLNLKDHLPKSFRKECTQFNNRVFDAIKSNDHVKGVVIVANWSGIDDSNQSKTFHKKVIEQLANMVKQLTNRDIKVTLYGPLPTSDFEPTMCLATSAFLGLNKSRCNSKPLAIGSLASELNLHFRSLSDDNNLVDFVDLEAALCDEQGCIVEIDNIPLYRDDDHLTNAAALKLSSILREGSY